MGSSPTLAHWLFGKLRKVLPGPLARYIRAVGTAVLTPVYFSLDTGHLRSSLKGRAVDETGNPIPWYSYPAIDMLAAQGFRDKAVLEFGAGHSTLWWDRQAKSVVSFETDEKRFRYVKSWETTNICIYLVKDCREAVAILCDGSQFDIVVIDGLDRVESSWLAIWVIAPKGILGNSEQPWCGQSLPHYRLSHREGFSRFDFHGYAPGVGLAHGTLIFFGGECSLFEGHKYG